MSDYFERFKPLKDIIKIFFYIIVINALTMSIPIPRLKKKKDIPLNYSINVTNRIDFQKGNTCAAFATAYVLRYFNIDSDGDTLYKQFPCKFPSGAITPLGIRISLKKHGFKTKYLKGNINNLKDELNNGVPVIIFVYLSPQAKERHFVPVTGYDENGFYIAESNKKLSNITNANGIYNRKVSYEDFKIMWNIKKIYMPLYSNTYIVAIPK